MILIEVEVLFDIPGQEEIHDIGIPELIEKEPSAFFFSYDRLSHYYPAINSKHTIFSLGSNQYEACIPVDIFTQMLKDATGCTLYNFKQAITES